MTIEEIKKQLRKKAIIFSTGGFRPTNEKLESWIGKVGWQNKGEVEPKDKNNRKMIPLATIFLDNLAYIPEMLKEIKLITVFVSIGILEDLANNDLAQYFEIRLYKEIENLEKCEYISEELLPFPLKPKLIENDYPDWEDLDDKMIKEIRKKEEEEGIDYFYDIKDNDSSYMIHKIGGYPASIQGGVGFSDGYEFVMQITSDSKARFNIVDGGNFYFGFNKQLEKWEVYCDFF